MERINPVYRCPRCNRVLHDASTRNCNNKLIHIWRYCEYCGMTQESVSDSFVDPVVWRDTEGNFIDPDTLQIYLLDTEDTD